MASPFQFAPPAGAPPNSPFGFGTANAAVPAASTPGFGTAPSAPAGFNFGGSTPATAGAAGFSFGNAGAKPAGAFGTPTGALFGASAAPAAQAQSAPVFGFSAAPAFGASTGTSAFGATTAPATTATFGAASSAPSLFGAPATTSTFGAQPAGTSSLFNFASQPAANSASALATNVFGQPPQQPAANALQQNPFGGQMVGFDPSGLTQDDAVRAILKIQNAYNPASLDFRFQALFLSVVERPEQRVKPPHVDENKWRQALASVKGPNNPQKLWPVAANGFQDLVARSKMQAGAIDENTQRLRALQDRVAAMARRSGSEFRGRVAALQRNQAALGHRLLHVMRCIDALESRLALSAGFNANQARSKDLDLSRQLAALEELAAPGSAVGLARRLEAVAAAARMRAGAGANPSMSKVTLDERSQTSLFAVLRDHAEAIRQLQDVLKQDELDLQVLKKLAAGAGSGGDLSSAMMM